MRWLWLAACLTGCYSPKLGDCEVACGTNNSCPPGLTCDNAVCRLPELVGMACVEEPVADANPNVDINPENCTWSLVSTNFAPADVPDVSPPAWDVVADEPFMTGGVDGKVVSQGPNAAPIWIVHKSRFTVAPGATLTIQGIHPLIIAADDMDIQGTIRVLNGSGHPTCNATPGANSCDSAAGGGGAGYGAEGGDGGGPPSLNGGIRDGVTPTPLRGGCPGAKGGNGQVAAGDPETKEGGSGGAGGGALQLSARKTFHLSGSILANGFAGGRGVSDPALGFACGGTGRASGGGGGGGGGTIFIESCAVMIDATSKLCANGGSGGGGAGGGSNNMDYGFPGEDGSCDRQAVGGLGETGAGQQGGFGGYDGMPATVGIQSTRGGGGGGGAIGRIHIYQAAGMPQYAGATIKPAANRAQ